MKILILGATGATGKHLLEKALAAGHEVTALVRDPKKLTVTHPKLRVIEGQVSKEDDVVRAVRGQDAVLSTLGPRDNKDPICATAAPIVAAAMKAEGVKRIVWLSASGVGDSKPALVAASFVFGYIIMPLFLKTPYANHARAEEALRATDLEWTVLRPVQLVDKLTGKPVVATPPDQKPASLKIAREDVAAFMLVELEKNAHVREMPLLYA
jgi:uncharacterized protein YbjT (DUF2867 family)